MYRLLRALLSLIVTLFDMIDQVEVVALSNYIYAREKFDEEVASTVSSTIYIHCS